MNSFHRCSTFLFAALGVATAASAQSITLFGQSWRVQRFDYQQEIVWPNPVVPGNTTHLLRVEGAWSLGNGRILVGTSHQDQAVPSTYANFLLEIQVNSDALGNVTGFSYVRTVVENDPALLGSPFDLRTEGLAINSASFGVGANGNIVVADSSASIVRGYDLATGALLPYGPGGVGLPLSPFSGNLSDLTFVPNANPALSRIYAIDEGAPAMRSWLPDGAGALSFPIAGAANPAVGAGDAKGLAYLDESPAWPPAMRASGGSLLVSMGDVRAGLQIFRLDGTEIGWEPVDNTLLPTSGPSIQPKIEAIATDPSTGRLFCFMEKGSLIDNWLWVLTPDCNGNDVADALDLASGLAPDLDGDGVLDTCSSAGTSFCAGDGVDATVTTACPCGNLGAFGRGCANSLNANGAVLTTTGTTASDSIVLHGEGMPANVVCIYLQGDGLTDEVFGDGVRCAGGALVRLRAVQNFGGASAFPNGSETVTLSQRGGVTPGSGALRIYQGYYRNAAAAFCPPETFNASNAWSTVW